MAVDHQPASASQNVNVLLQSLQHQLVESERRRPTEAGRILLGPPPLPQQSLLQTRSRPSQQGQLTEAGRNLLEVPVALQQPLPQPRHDSRRHNLPVEPPLAPSRGVLEPGQHKGKAATVASGPGKSQTPVQGEWSASVGRVLSEHQLPQNHPGRTPVKSKLSRFGPAMSTPQPPFHAAAAFEGDAAQEVIAARFPVNPPMPGPPSARQDTPNAPATQIQGQMAPGRMPGKAATQRDVPALPANQRSGVQGAPGLVAASQGSPILPDRLGQDQRPIESGPAASKRYTATPTPVERAPDSFREATHSFQGVPEEPPSKNLEAAGVRNAGQGVRKRGRSAEKQGSSSNFQKCRLR
jgi:hypothetical protein